MDRLIGRKREKVMKFYEASMPEELGKMGIDVGKAGIERMEEERVKKMEKRRKVELIKDGIRRMYFKTEGGPGGVLNFGKNAGWRFADVYMKDASFAEWALGLDKIKMWKLECFKFFLRRLLDLERVTEQEGEPEETVKTTRVGVNETLVEEMACEEMKVEEYKEGTKQKVRRVDVEDEHET